jgi:hypothetical protein
MTACAIIRQVAAAAPPPTAAEVRCVNGERSHMAQMDGCRWLVVSMPLNVVVTAPTTTVFVGGNTDCLRLHSSALHSVGLA